MLQRALSYVLPALVVANVLLLAYLVWPQTQPLVALTPHPAVVAQQAQTPPALIAQGDDAFALMDPALAPGVSPKVFKRFHVRSGQAHPKKEPFSGVLNLNTASLGELQKLPGIGPKMALRIVAYRKAHGPFASLQDLGAVEGIGPKKLAKLAPFCKF